MASDLEKIRVLLPHWIEHNNEHIAEFRAWSAKVEAASAELLAAIEHMRAAGDALQAALDKVGGPLHPDMG